MPWLKLTLKSPCADFLDPLLPVGLAEEVVVQQDDVPWVRFLSPDVPDGLLLDHGSLFPGHHAELALQPTAPLREADAVQVVRVHLVVLLLRGDADVFQSLGHVPSGSPNLDEWVLLEKSFRHGPGPLEDQAGVGAVKRRPVGCFHGFDRWAMLEGNLVASASMVGGDTHEGNVRQLAVELQEEDFQSPPCCGIIASRVFSM